MTTYQKIPGVWKLDRTTKKYSEEWGTPFIEFLRNNQWICTEKIDGMNFRIIWDGYRVSYAGRTDAATFREDVNVMLRDRFLSEAFETQIEQIFSSKPAVLYGELFGKKIQSCPMQGVYLNKVEVRIFDVKIGNTWQAHDQVLEIASALELETAPVCMEGTLQDAKQWLLEHTHSTLPGADGVIEGLVCRPRHTLLDPFGERIICKIKGKLFPESWIK